MDPFSSSTSPVHCSSSLNAFPFAPRNSFSHYNNISTIDSDFGATLQKAFHVENGHFKHRNSKGEFVKAVSAKLTASWIQNTFQRRDCIKFVADGSSIDRCGCGRSSAAHPPSAFSRFQNRASTASCQIPFQPPINAPSTSSVPVDFPEKKWNIAEHTRSMPTDSFGTIEFQGGPHPHKAHYVRLAFDSDPGDIVHLMEKIWNLPKPKLVITIHGGVGNFTVPDKLGKKFREGLLKAAQTTEAWIITSGLSDGVVKHVAQALDEAGISARMRSQILLIGIAPWGLVRRRDKLIGLDSKVTYEHPSYCQKNTHHPVLNDRHSYFLLADNGTVGRYGADIILRKRFEDYLAQKTSLRGGPERTPIIGVTVEGGFCTINSVLQYLSGNPPIPVVVCEGSGRASDLLAFAEKYADSQGNFDQFHRQQLLNMVKEKLIYDQTTAAHIVDLICDCAKHKDLLTIYRRNPENKDDVDQVILRALLKGENLSSTEKLSLVLAWNRVDMARSEIFSSDQDVPPQALYPIMMNCLLMNRVDFFKLLIEQGVSMKKFLTISRLEQLYNAEPGILSTFYHLLGKTDSSVDDNALSLPEIGTAIDKLMGNAYRCCYTSRSFKNKYEKFKRKDKQLSRISSFHLKLKDYTRKNDKKERSQSTVSEPVEDFKYPFNDLMLWAVLTRRHELAKCIWNHGEEAMAKALVAIRLYRCMGKLAAGDYTEVEVSNRLKEYAEEFRECSFELLNHCYQQDDVMTMRMLTAELPNWGHQTCLSLAVIANNKRLLTHPCCQILLAELWHGGLRFRSQSNFKVLLAVFFPPSILLLDFKKPTYQSKNRVLMPSVEESDDDEPCDDSSNHFNLSLTTIFNNTITSKLLRKRTIAEPTKFSKIAMDSEPDVPLTSNAPVSDSENRKVQIYADVNPIPGDFKRNHSTNSHQSSSVVKTWMNDCISKFSLFYRAPITSFWIWAISFLVFMMAFIFVLLVEFKNTVTNIEWFLFVYVLGFGLEHFRKLLVTESSSQMEKIRVFYNSYWNVLTTFSIVMFFIGFYYRFFPETIHSRSRTILAVNSVLWNVKIFHYLSVHPKIGPYIQMAGKMMANMVYIILMLLVALMAFGVARQSITYPHEKWDWLLVRNIFYKPYFMLYGEVYAGEIDQCGDEGVNCVAGYWIPPILMTAFLLVANILLINMLIAIFNNIFNVTNALSHQVWMFQRYGQVLEYKNTPIVPPPFTPIIHLWMLAKYLCRRISCKPNRRRSLPTLQDQGLDLAIKVHLEEDELQKIRDFEEDCMDDLARRNVLLPDSPTEKKDNSIFADIIEENVQLKSELYKMRCQLEMIQQNQTVILETLQNVNSANNLQPAEDELQNSSANILRPSSFALTPSATSEMFEHKSWEHSLDTIDGAALNLSQMKAKRPPRKRKSVSLSEDIEQMIQMSSNPGPNANELLFSIRNRQPSTFSASSRSSQSAESVKNIVFE